MANSWCRIMPYSLCSKTYGLPFSRLANEPLYAQRQTLSSAQQMHRLVSDIDRLDEFVLRVVSPWLFAVIATLCLAGLLWWLLPLATMQKLFICFLMLMAVVLPIGVALTKTSFAKRLADMAEKRRQALLQPLSILTHLILWQQWQPQSQAFLAWDDAHLEAERAINKTQGRLKTSIQLALFATILLILMAILNAITTNTLTPNLNSNIPKLPISIPLLLALILGLLGLGEILIPLGQNYLAWGNSVGAKNRLNALVSGLIDDNAVLSDGMSNNSVLNDRITLPTQPIPLDAPLQATLKGVSAKFPDAIAGATNIDATINSGKPLLVQGTSGSGKTTLLQMLAGELPLLAGEITLNGQPWHSYDWQDQLGYLGQQIDIFDQTLAVNLRLGKADATDAELMTALKQVGLANWVYNLPQGLATPLGEYGMAVSGGQARRIALARLLLKPRRVMLLDEPLQDLMKRPAIRFGSRSKLISKQGFWSL